MYTWACRVEFKETILKSFTSCDGILRVATTAFSMGIDCTDIERIIHWGTPGTLEQYVQETGRAGRDGRQAKAILLYGKPGRYVEEQMNPYLFSWFKATHSFISLEPHSESGSKSDSL